MMAFFRLQMSGSGGASGALRNANNANKASNARSRLIALSHNNLVRAQEEDAEPAPYNARSSSAAARAHGANHSANSIANGEVDETSFGRF